MTEIKFCDHRFDRAVDLRDGVCHNEVEARSTSRQCRLHADDGAALFTQLRPACLAA